MSEEYFDLGRTHPAVSCGIYYTKNTRADSAIPYKGASSRKGHMKRWKLLGGASIVILVLTVVALARVSALPQAAPEEAISGTIGATRIITQNARLTGNVTCTVNSAPCIQFGAPGLMLNLNGFTITARGLRPGMSQGLLMKMAYLPLVRVT